MWNTLSAAIKAVVQTSTNIDSNLVYDYAKTNIGGYPAVTITAADGDGEFADTRRNKRTYVFSIKVYQEQLEQGRDDSERIMRTIVDELITLFDADYYLGATLQGRGYVKVVPSKWEFIQGEQVSMRMAEILLAAVVIQ